MRRITNAILFTSFIVTTSLSSTGCLDIADALLGTGPDGVDRSGAPGATGDIVPLSCSVAKDRCETFAATFCDKLNACRGDDFDGCIQQLADSGKLPCDQADGEIGDMEQCDDELDALDCGAFLNNEMPQVCNESAFHFSNDVCR